MNTTLPVCPHKNPLTSLSQHRLSDSRPSVSPVLNPQMRLGRSDDLDRATELQGPKHPWVWSWNLSPTGPKEGLKQDDRMHRGPRPTGDHAAQIAGQHSAKPQPGPVRSPTGPRRCLTSGGTEQELRPPRLGAAGRGRSRGGPKLLMAAGRFCRGRFC